MRSSRILGKTGSRPIVRRYAKEDASLLHAKVSKCRATENIGNTCHNQDRVVVGHGHMRFVSEEQL